MTLSSITGRFLRRWTVQCSRLRESENGTCEQKEKVLFGSTFSQKKAIQVEQVELCSICNANWSRGGKDPKQYTRYPLLKHLRMKHPKEIQEI